MSQAPAASDAQKLQLLRKEFLKLRSEHEELQQKLVETNKMKAKLKCKVTMHGPFHLILCWLGSSQWTAHISFAKTNFEIVVGMLQDDRKLLSEELAQANAKIAELLQENLQLKDTIQEACPPPNTISEIHLGGAFVLNYFCLFVCLFVCTGSCKQRTKLCKPKL